MDSYIFGIGYPTTGLEHLAKLKDQHRSLRRSSHRQRKRQRDRDDFQDEVLMELVEENDRIKVCLSSLLSILAAKDLLTDEEWLAIAELSQGEGELDLIEPHGDGAASPSDPPS